MLKCGWHLSSSGIGARQFWGSVARQSSGWSLAGGERRPRNATPLIPVGVSYATPWVQSAHSTPIPVSVSLASPWIERVVGAAHHGRNLPLASEFPARDALKDRLKTSLRQSRKLNVQSLPCVLAGSRLPTTSPRFPLAAPLTVTLQRAGSREGRCLMYCVQQAAVPAIGPMER